MQKVDVAEIDDGRELLAVTRAQVTHSWHCGLPPMGTFPSKGGGPNDYVYVYTSRANPEHWRRLLAVIGREDLIGDARYDSPTARSERAAEVNEMVAAWTRRHTKHEAMEIIGAAGISRHAKGDRMSPVEILLGLRNSRNAHARPQRGNEQPCDEISGCSDHRARRLRAMKSRARRLVVSGSENI